MATPQQEPLAITIVIPCRNEAQDIRLTLDRCLALDYPEKEILVVDDSTDDTPRIVAEYADRGVRLIHREENVDGCCGARNEGIRHARGEVIVLLNADAIPARDFLHRIAAHYRDGADWLVVRSRVHNRESLWGQYLYAEERMNWDGRAFDPWWSEGVSFRRSAAEAVGLIPGRFPVRFCRDNTLGFQFAKHGFVKHVDEQIVMEHVVPDDFASFWPHRVWRGTMCPPNFFYFRGMSLPAIALREAAKTGYRFLFNALLLPRIWKSARYASKVGGLRKLPGQVVVGILDDLAYTIGTWRMFRRLLAAEGWSARPPAALVPREV